MEHSMKISKFEFEQELDSLLDVAMATKSKSTAEGFLKQAWSKADGYYNIPESWAKRYKEKVENLAKELGIDL